MERKMLGRHALGEFYGIDSFKLNDEDVIKFAIIKAVKNANMNLVKLVSYKFEPQGITAFGILAESHISIHTYPELGSCSVDCYTCGNEGNPMEAIYSLIEMFDPKEIQIKEVKRGNNKYR